MSWNAIHSWSVGEILVASWHNNNDQNLSYVARELDYAQIVAPSAGVTATTEATAVAVITGNSVTYDGGRVLVSFSVPGVNNTGSNIVGVFVLLRDTTVLGQVKFVPSGSANSSTPIRYEIPDTPAAGAHTYKLSAFTASGTLTVQAGPGGSGAIVPAWLRVTNARQ